MDLNYITRGETTISFCPKLKWYQWILQKLHIKNYYKKITVYGVYDENNNQYLN